MAFQAVLLDLDGTLLDSNSLHIEAWRRAFEQCGHEVAPERIAPEIGRAGEEIIQSILGDGVAEESSKAIREAVIENVPVVGEELRPLRVLEGAREIFQALHERNLKFAIATAAGEVELKTLTECSGLDVCRLADVVTTKDDAENSKPEPDILLAACDKLQVPPGDALFVGDTIWDAKSAQNAGVVSVGVLECSAFSADELKDAGMTEVFSTLSELQANLDSAFQLQQ